MNIKRLSIQLLQAFDALYTTQNVTYAGEKIGISQAAMSNNLKQLRELFDDQLFIRKSKGITPTNIAHQLSPKVKQAIGAVENVLNNNDYDELAKVKNIGIALSDYGEYLVLPSLYDKLLMQNKNITVTAVRFHGKINLMDFHQGKVRLAIGVLQHESSELTSELLFKERAVCVMNKCHPLANETLSMECYKNAKHISVIPQSEDSSSFIDDALSKIDIKRDVRVTATHLTTALQMIEQQELIGTFPEKICRLKGIHFNPNLVLKPVPYHIPPGEIKLFWLKTDDGNTAHRWLRELVKTTIPNLEPSN